MTVAVNTAIRRTVHIHLTILPITRPTDTRQNITIIRRDTDITTHQNIIPLRAKFLKRIRKKSIIL